MDPYKVLGLEPGASQAEVKRAYRHLAKTLHPDSAGERSLSAFLAVQEAYEQLIGGRPRGASGRGRSAGPAGSPGSPGSAGPRGPGVGGYGRTSGPWQEPWRADPERARAAREQARARRGPTWSSGFTSERASRASSTGQASGAPGAPQSGGTGDASRRTAGGAGGASRDAGGSGRGRPSDGAGPRRRRPSRKATMGSTSYDDARDATDSRWAGASWYGPTTGEYWIVNPREYADPRKHGPGYSSRARTGPPLGSTRAPEWGTAGAPPGAASAGDEAAAEPAREPDVIAEDADEPMRRRPRQGPAWTGAAPGVAAGAAFGPASVDPTPAAPGPSLEDLGRSFVASLFGTAPPDPVRRVGLALLGWPPLGIAASSVIGTITGCATYAVSCDGADPLLPWFAQAVIVGLLLLAVPLARVAASGTLGLIVGLLPATALLIVLGGAGTAGAGTVLALIVSIAWLAGAILGLRHELRA